MKNILLCFLLLFFTNNLFCQIFAKDVTTENEGLSVETELFSSTFYLYNKEISSQSFEELIRLYPSAQRNYIQGKNLRTFGNIISIGSVIVIGPLYYLSLYGIGNRNILVGSGVTLLLGIIMVWIAVAAPS